jgi:hypothetical protein
MDVSEVIIYSAACLIFSISMIMGFQFIRGLGI